MLWSEENVEELKLGYEIGLSTEEIGIILNRSPNAIRHKAILLELKHPNRNSKRKKECPICLNCTNIVKLHTNKYCSVQCQKDYEYKEYIKIWKNGEAEVTHFSGKTKTLSNYIRRYLLNKYNNTCIKCGWNKLHPIDNKPLVEINHIDGNAENCLEENLEVICPNCHSMTHNFRARNKNSTRER